MGGGGHVGTRSVLFTDLVDSTEVRVRLGEDGADALRRTHDVLITDAVAANGGTVVKGLGDGVMATFESAVTAVAGRGSDPAGGGVARPAAPDQPLAIRVGVSIGDVSTEDADVFGVPVVEAARLCATARRRRDPGRRPRPGTRARARALRVRADGIARAEGTARPRRRVPRGLGTAARDGRRRRMSQVPISPALLGAATPYVGRARLREQLDAGWTAVRGGSCRTTLLAGEPGVGKTRTAAELARSAYTDGALVLYGRCDEDLDVPYQPFVESLEYYARNCAGPVAGPAGGRTCPAGAGPRGARPRPAVGRDVRSGRRGIPPVRGRDILVAPGVPHRLRRARPGARRHPLGNEADAAPARARVRGATDEHAPVWILATYRDTDIDRTHPLSAALGDLRRLPGVDRLPVSNLSSDEVLDVHRDGGRTRTGRTHAAARGRDLCRDGGQSVLHRRGASAPDRDRRRAALRRPVGRREPDTVTVPEGVRDVVGRRLSRLTESANAVLSVAAVIGREFDLEALFAVSRPARGRTARRHRPRGARPPGRPRPGSTVPLRARPRPDDAVRRAVGDAARRLHRRVADVLEKTRPDDVRALAHHCTQAGGEGADLARAVHYTLAAAEQSLAARAFADAEVGFRAALDLLADGEATDPGSRRRAVRSRRGAARPGRRRIPRDAVDRVGPGRRTRRPHPARREPCSRTAAVSRASSGASTGNG